MTIERAEKFRFSDQSHGDRRSSSRVFFVRWKILLDGLEKSQARAASFPCSKFYCRFYIAQTCRSGQAAAGWPRFAPFSLLFFLSFHSFDFLSSPHSSLFLVASLTAYVCLFGRARVLQS
jgi:hypothetical protein